MKDRCDAVDEGGFIQMAGCCGNVEQGRAAEPYRSILNSCHKPYRKQNVTVIGFGRLYRKADGTRRQMKRRVRVEHSISV